MNEVSINGKKNIIEVILYSSPACRYSRMAKDFLIEHNIVFTEHNVLSDYGRAREMISVSGQSGIPVIVIIKNGKKDFHVGYDREILLEAIFKG